MKLLIVLVALIGCVVSLPQSQVAEVFPVYVEDDVVEPAYDETVDVRDEPDLANDEMPVLDPAAEVVPSDELPIEDEYVPRTHVIIRPFYFKSFRPFLRMSPVFPFRRESDVVVDDPSVDVVTDGENVEPEYERQPSLWDFLFRDFPPFLSSRPRRPETETPVEDTPSVGGDRPGFHSVWNSFFDRPLFPQLPRVDHSEYPDNYSNSTYDVHEVNGTKFAVNTTVHKQSGPNFNNFFHFRVVHHVPEEETPEQVPQENPEEIIPEENPEYIPEADPDYIPEADPDYIPEADPDYIPEADPDYIPQADPDYIPEENPEANVPRGDVPEENPEELPLIPVEIPVEVESTNEIPEVPEIYNEINNEIQPEKNRDEDLVEFYMKDDPNVNVAGSYILPWFKEDKPKDLSSDTRVNRVLAGNEQQQGMTAVDPDAEVFDIDAVFRELNGENE